MRRWWKRDALVFLIYAAISFAYFAAPLLGQPHRVVFGEGGDPFIFIWSFAWWPHAIGTWTNPFFTHALYAPEGINLAWTTSVPGLALPFAPLTLAAGPVASFDVAAILLPALAAWTAYRLCLHLTGSRWASFFGGYVYGFSSFVVAAQLQAHLNFSGAFLVPVVALVVVRYLEGALDTRGLAWRVGLLVAAELTISTEVTVTLTLALAAGLALAALFAPQRRGRIRAALAPLVGGYALAAVVTAPLVVYLLLGFHGGSFTGAENSNTDLANFLVPTRQNGILGSSFSSVHAHFHETEAGAYLGLPVLIIVALYAWRGRRTAATRFLLVAFLLVALATLGDTLFVDGHRVMTLPWSYIRHLPVLDNIRPTRFALYLGLLGGLMVALWTARTKGRVYARPYLLPVLAVAALVPAVWHAYFRQTPRQWAFFSSSCAESGETLAVFPWDVTGDVMLAQVDHGFHFRLAGGYLSPSVPGTTPVSSFGRDQTVQYLEFLGDQGLPSGTRLLAFAGTHGVARIVADPGEGWPTAAMLRAAGPVASTGGLLVAPACGAPPLAARKTAAAVATVTKEDENQETMGWCLGTNYYALPRDLVPAGQLAGATHADLINGVGLGCSPPPGYTRHGFATADMGVPPNTYPYYTS